MAVKVAINGFGRIGRLAYRAMVEQGLVGDAIDVVAVGDIVPADSLAYLVKYDSTQGTFPGEVTHRGDDTIIVNGDEMKVVSAREPSGLPWKELGVDVVIESTGLFTAAEKSQGHIEAGAKKVIISAPAKGEDLTVVMGVNDNLYDPANHHIVSNASCTTNCLAPAAKVVYDRFGIVKGLMTTVHSYTNDQRILDLAHPKDARRARAAALNIIPTTTGAAKAVALVIPGLKGKFDGFALRVPTPTVSIVDFVAETEKPVTLEALKAAFKEAAEGEMKGILGYNEDPLVSMDFKGDSRSSIVDAPSLMTIGENMVKVVAWYDNEWGYSCRTADLAAMVAKSL